VSCLRIARASSVFFQLIESYIGSDIGFVFYVVEILPMCRDLDIIFYGCIYELMT